TVKKQIIGAFGKKYENKIVALHEGVDFEKMSKMENLQLSETYTKKFFLYVGNFYPHKNVERLIKAFARIKKDVQLILIGQSGFFSQRTKDLITSLKMEDKIVFCPDASDEDLIYFYKHAEALVHPSLSEGFGLPVIEARYFGTSVIASNIPVFKEILGDDYVMFNSTDEKDIQDKIERFITEKKPEKPLSKDFSFEKMTKSLLDIYEKATVDEVYASVVVFFTKNKEVLMLHRSRSSFGEEWGFIGGTIEKNETPDRAATREVMEEVGYKIQNLTFLKKYDSQYSKDVSGKVYIYVAPFPGFEKFSSTKEGDVRSDLKLFSIDDARRLNAFSVVKDILSDVEKYLYR
ncbi:MAG: glycosyltransferase, partial [Patescibacteria group bacterium]